MKKRTPLGVLALDTFKAAIDKVKTLRVVDDFAGSDGMSVVLEAEEEITLVVDDDLAPAEDILRQIVEGKHTKAEMMNKAAEALDKLDDVRDRLKSHALSMEFAGDELKKMASNAGTEEAEELADEILECWSENREILEEEKNNVKIPS